MNRVTKQPPILRMQLLLSYILSVEWKFDKQVNYKSIFVYAVSSFR